MSKNRGGKRIFFQNGLTTIFGHGKANSVRPNVICSVNQIEIVSVRFADFGLARRQKILRVKIRRGGEGSRVSKFFVNFGTIIAAFGQNFAQNFLKQNRQRAMVLMRIKIHAKNHVRPKFQQQIFQIALEIFPRVRTVPPESFFRVVDKIFRRVSFRVACGRSRRLVGKFVPVAVA